MEPEGQARELDQRAVFCGQTNRCAHSRTTVLHGHLVRVELDSIFFGFADYSVAQFLVLGHLSKANTSPDLRRDVLHVVLELNIGQFAGADLPTRHEHQEESGYSESDCEVPHIFKAQFCGADWRIDSARCSILTASCARPMPLKDCA